MCPAYMAMRRAVLEPRRPDPAISQCGSCFDSSSLSLFIAMASWRGEKKPQVPLNAHCNHIEDISPCCWLKQGDGTFGCSQASSLHCGVSRAGKFTLSFTVNVQVALTTLSCSQQQSNLCGPCFLGHLPTPDLSLLLSHSTGSRDMSMWTWQRCLCLLPPTKSSATVWSPSMLLWVHTVITL